MVLTWAASGQGECTLTLLEAQELAVEAGFTFQCSTEAMPLARRADLQAMFDHFGVNSLSAFRRKFWAYELCPTTSGKAGSESGTAMPPLQPAAPGSSGRLGFGSSCSRWGVQQGGGQTYVGELLDGRWHGSGILLTQGERSRVLHVGRFSEGKRNGPGVVATSRGERFEGFFMDDVMWGPGQYAFARHQPPAAALDQHAANAPEQGQQPQLPHRLSFCGMMNGRPAGKGCLEWSDGSRQVGQFDGANCYLRMRDEEIAGVLLVAADNAEAARVVAVEAQAAAAQQEGSIARQAQELFASIDPTGAAGAHAHVSESTTAGGIAAVQ